MGLQTIAEFVENQAILDKLTEIGVDYAQGYHIHKPEELLDLKESEDNVLQFDAVVQTLVM